MADTEPNEHPDCFHQADIDEATGRLVEIIRRTRPQVLITYNDDQAGYPHPDHLRVHEISLLAFDRAGDPSWYPELGDPFQPLKLYYSTWSRRRLVAIHEGLIRHRGESPFDETWFERPDTDHRVNCCIAVGDYMWARTQSLKAHATQVDPTAAFWFGLSDDELRRDLPVGGLDSRSVTRRRPAEPRPTRARSVRGDQRGSHARGRLVSVQYRVVVAKKDERVEGPDDADIVVTVPVAVATDDDFDATVEFMRGRLKAAGHTGRILDLLKSGDATAAITRLASRP